MSEKTLMRLTGGDPRQKSKIIFDDGVISVFGVMPTVQKVVTSGEEFPQDEREGIDVDLFERRLTVLQVNSAVQDLWSHIPYRTNLSKQQQQAV